MKFHYDPSYALIIVNIHDGQAVHYSNDLIYAQY